MQARRHLEGGGRADRLAHLPDGLAARLLQGGRRRPQDLFPAGPRDQAKIDQEWTYDKFLVAAQKLHEAGHDFGNPIGPTSDSQDWLGPLFLSFGGQMVSPAGEITVDFEGTGWRSST